jgi:hypothetical protein
VNHPLSLLNVVHNSAFAIQFLGKDKDDVIERMVPLGEHFELTSQDEKQMLKAVLSPLHCENIPLFLA